MKKLYCEIIFVMSSTFIKKQIVLYKNLEPCYCPAIQDTVYFTSEGLNHLLYYRRRPRGHSEKHYRAGLISHLVEVISSTTTAIKDIKSEKPLIITWNLQYEVDGNGGKQIVKVILKKEGAGKVKFLSTMRKKYSNTTQI